MLLIAVLALFADPIAPNLRTIPEVRVLWNKAGSCACQATFAVNYDAPQALTENDLAGMQVFLQSLGFTSGLLRRTVHSTPHAKDFSDDFVENVRQFTVRETIDEDSMYIERANIKAAQVINVLVTIQTDCSGTPDFSDINSVANLATLSADLGVTVTSVTVTDLTCSDCSAFVTTLQSSCPPANPNTAYCQTVASAVLCGLASVQAKPVCDYDVTSLADLVSYVQTKCVAFLPTASPTTTSSVTPSSTVSPTTSRTPTSSRTPSPSVTPSSSVTPSTSVTPTVSRTPSTSVTPSRSVTPSSSVTRTVTPSSSITPTTSRTPSVSVTPSRSVTPSPTTSRTTTPSTTPSRSVTPSPSSSRSETATPSSSRSETPTSSVSPSTSVSPTPTPSLGCVCEATMVVTYNADQPLTAAALTDLQSFLAAVGFTSNALQSSVAATVHATTHTVHTAPPSPVTPPATPHHANSAHAMGMEVAAMGTVHEAMGPAAPIDMDAGVVHDSTPHGMAKAAFTFNSLVSVFTDCSADPAFDSISTAANLAALSTALNVDVTGIAFNQINPTLCRACSSVYYDIRDGDCPARQPTVQYCQTVNSAILCATNQTPAKKLNCEFDLSTLAGLQDYVQRCDSTV